MACDCNKPNITSNQNVAPTTTGPEFNRDAGSSNYTQTVCTSITSDLLSLWKRKVDCVITYNFADEIGYDSTTLTNAQSLLANWITVKDTNPDSCEYIENLQDTQRLINRIITKGLCI